MKTKVTKESNNRIKVTDSDGGYIESQSVEANLLFLILNALEKALARPSTDESVNFDVNP